MGEEETAEDSGWEVFNFPFKITGADQRKPALLLGLRFAYISVLLGLVGGLALDAMDQAIDPGFLTTVDGIIIGTFLALLSLMAMFSVFVHDALMRKKGIHREALAAMNDRLHLGLTPYEIDNPRDPKVRAYLNSLPKERDEWIGSHRSIESLDVLAQYVRFSMERLALVSLAVVVPALVVLGVAPWVVLLNPLAVGTLAFVLCFAIWAVWETIEHIFVSLKLVNEPYMMLRSVHEADGRRYTVLAWFASGERRLH